MAPTFNVCGLSCRVENGRATVYVQKPKTDSGDCAEECTSELLAHLVNYGKARNVAKYLVDEGFIDGKLPIRIQEYH